MPNKRWTILLASLGVFMTALDTLDVQTLGSEPTMSHLAARVCILAIPLA